MSTWQQIVNLITKFPLAFSTDVFLLTAITVGLYTINYFDKTFKTILLFLTVCFCVELVVIYYAAHGWTNYFLINITSFVETVFFSMVYWIEIVNRRSRTIIITLLGSYLLLFAYSFQWQHIAEFLLGVERLILIVFVILHLQFVLETMRVHNLLTYPMFWVSSGTMVYAAGTLFIFTFTKVTFGDPNDLWYWFIVQWFTCLLYTVLAAAFYLRRREVIAQTVS